MDEYIERKAALSQTEILTVQTQEYGKIDVVPIEYIANLPTINADDVAPVVWKPIMGFEGLYEISSMGQVRNKNKKIIKQQIKRTNSTCYKTVSLWKCGHYYKKYIHRLIAEAFLPNPNNLPFVNHKDEDGTNNLMTNLEWCTREYNVNYGTAKQRRVKKIRGIPHSDSHKAKISDGLRQYYSENEVWNKGKKYPSCGAKMREAR